MSAWWVALAGWAVAGWLAICARSWRNCAHSENHKRNQLQFERDNESGQRFLAEMQRDTWSQQALDDRAACDAMREELQRMKSRKRRAKPHANV